MFAFASEKKPLPASARKPLPAILAVPLICQAAVIAFPVHPAGLDRLTVLLFLAAALYLLLALPLQTGRRTRQAAVFGFAYLILAAVALACNPKQAPLVGRAELTLLLLGAAFLFGRSTVRVHRGVILAISGMTLWALTWPMLTLYAWLFRPILAALNHPRTAGLPDGRRHHPHAARRAHRLNRAHGHARSPD